LPGIIPEPLDFFLSISANRLRSFNELATSYPEFARRQWIVMHRVVHRGREAAKAWTLVPPHGFKPRRRVNRKFFTAKTSSAIALSTTSSREFLGAWRGKAKTALAGGFRRMAGLNRTDQALAGFLTLTLAVAFFRLIQASRRLRF